MIAPLGAQSDRLTRVASLKTAKGRRRHKQFAFEGPTLLDEALRAGTPIDELYVTQAALDAHSGLAERASGVPVHIVTERSFAKISDVETPAGLLAVAPAQRAPLEALLDGAGLVAVLAGLNDPGNAGTLLRSADAFEARGAVFGEGGVDPFSPKVVRAGMGAFFRLKIAVATPGDFAQAAASSAFTAIGLRAGAQPLHEVDWPERTAMVVGHERHGLGPWEGLCERFAGIPIGGAAESLNAAVAGSIAFYEAARSAGKRIG
ncbi:MAG: RNA methyltransferase [Candidatus Tumulicola sp.]